MRKIIYAFLIGIIGFATTAYGLNIYIVDTAGKELSNKLSVELDVRPPVLLGGTSSPAKETLLGNRVTLLSGKASLPDLPTDQAYRIVVRDGDAIVAQTRLFDKNQQLPSDHFVKNGIVLDPISTAAASPSAKK